MIGFSLYLHTGAPENAAGPSCHGIFLTASPIILTSLIFETSIKNIVYELFFKFL